MDQNTRKALFTCVVYTNTRRKPSSIFAPHISPCSAATIAPSLLTERLEQAIVVSYRYIKQVMHSVFLPLLQVC